MTLDDRNGIPLYRQLSTLLRSKIMSGEWQPDEKLPTEPELCEKYGISRMTVRLALDELRNSKHIYKRQGKGTFVSLPKIDQNLSSSYSFTDEIEEMGYTIHKSILLWNRECAGDELANKLQISPADYIFKIERILRCNDKPFAIETSCIPEKLCPELTRSSDKNIGLYKSLNIYGIRPNSASETFEAILLDKNAQKLLETDTVAPGFFVQRLSYHDNIPVEYCQGFINGKIVRYKVALH